MLGLEYKISASVAVSTVKLNRRTSAADLTLTLSLKVSSTTLENYFNLPKLFQQFYFIIHFTFIMMTFALRALNSNIIEITF